VAEKALEKEDDKAAAVENRGSEVQLCCLICMFYWISWVTYVEFSVVATFVNFLTN